MASSAGVYENGVFRKGHVRISDLAGCKRLPVGVSVFPMVAEHSVFIDKTLLIADVLSQPGAITLFCRPRRFGKSLNLSMLQSFLEIPSVSDPFAIDTKPLFRGLTIWDVEEGRYQRDHAAYPVVRLSFNNAKGLDWPSAKGMIRESVVAEYGRHYYLLDDGSLNPSDREVFTRIAERRASDEEFSSSLLILTRLLSAYHGRGTVVLIDEYDAPVMAGYTHGYYDEVVSFLKRLLTGALKDNPALVFGVLTGVQRISKESIFSDLNNLTVNTSLSVASEERYGFTQEEIEALAEYLGSEGGLSEARQWYDGYRFGSVDVYNPWSALNYFKSGCVADVYWGNTSGNGVLGDMIRDGSNETMSDLYRLLEPGGVVFEPLDTSVVFPDIGIKHEALWSMLYLAGYLTTDDTDFPNSTNCVRALRIPNREVAQLYRSEVVERFSRVAGGRRRLRSLHFAFANGDADALTFELECILSDNASYHDLTCETSYHMLMLGLLFGMSGYCDPVSNREAGHGRFDVRVAPLNADRDPLITLEIKWTRPATSKDCALDTLAETALSQIDEHVYESGAETGTAGVLKWGIAFSDKRVACACRTH
ncbi:AAA family ATPase [Adlercreutzia sp. ZJ138]|uniref:AAA family ATPase n=1 Tax=Adlercreutzia sp. ZJ138 TaxID=2709405 RepID=UPI0013ECFD5D|nr:AAA family ATPase [Adlercreutzia sp. ZJ138]